MGQKTLLKIEQVGEKGIRINDADLYLRTLSAEVQGDHVYIYPESARNGDTYVGKIGEVRVNDDVPTTPEEAITALEFIGNFKGGGDDTALKERVATLEGEMPGKADKIVTPHVDWVPSSFSVPAGRTLKFNTSTAPKVTGTELPTIAVFSNINGDSAKMLGFYSNDGGVTTRAGLFHINDDETAFVADVLLYDGVQWLNDGEIVFPYDVAGDFNEEIGDDTVLVDFDLNHDVTVPDVPVMNLADVYDELSGETRQLRVDVDGTMTGLVQETAARVSGDNDLQTQIDAMQGQTRRFFVDFAVEFGTDTPTIDQTNAWLAARTPALTPNVGTAFKNHNTSQATYNHLFVYYTDPADSEKLILSDDGVDTVSTASASSLGVVRGAGDVGVDLNGDMIIGAKVVTDEKMADYTTANPITEVKSKFASNTPFTFKAFLNACVARVNGLFTRIAELHHTDPADSMYINPETGNDDNDGLTSATAVKTAHGAQARLLSYTGPLAFGDSGFGNGWAFNVHVAAVQDVSTPPVSLDPIGPLLVRWGYPAMRVYVDTSTGGTRARVQVGDTVEYPAKIEIGTPADAGVMEVVGSRFRDKRVIIPGRIHEDSSLTFHNCDVNLPCLPFAWTAYTSRVIVGAPDAAYVGTPPQRYWRGYWRSTLILGVVMPDYGGQVSIALDDTCVLKGNLLQSLTSVLNGTPVTIGHPQALETPFYDAAMVAPVRNYFRASQAGMAVGDNLYVSCDKDALFAAYRSSGNNWRMYVSALDGSSIEVQSFVTLQYGTTATYIGQYTYNNHAAATYHDITNGDRSFSGGGKAEALVYFPKYDKVYRFIVMCYGASAPLTCIAMVKQEL
jgi:hypothetical protein